MYPTPSRRDRASASTSPHPGRPTPGYQAVLLVLFAAGLWTVSHPSLAATLVTVAGLAVAGALSRHRVRAGSRPGAKRSE